MPRGLFVRARLVWLLSGAARAQLAGDDVAEDSPIRVALPVEETLDALSKSRKGAINHPPGRVCTRGAEQVARVRPPRLRTGGRDATTIAPQLLSVESGDL